MRVERAGGRNPWNVRVERVRRPEQKQPRGGGEHHERCKAQPIGENHRYVDEIFSKKVTPPDGRSGIERSA